MVKTLICEEASASVRVSGSFQGLDQTFDPKTFILLVWVS